MAPGRAILLAACLAMSPAGAEELDCDLIEWLVGAGEVASLKGAPLGFHGWRSNLLIAGFDRCRILDGAPGEVEDASYELIIECTAAMPTEEAAAHLAGGTVEALTTGCGRAETMIAPTFGAAGIMALDPVSGVALQTSLDTRLFDFSVWRSELREGLEETTIPKHTLSLSILIPEVP